MHLHALAHAGHILGHLSLSTAFACTGFDDTASIGPQQLEIVFLAGQSNADGRAPSATLPPSFRSPRGDVLLYSHLHGESPNPDGTLGSLGPLRPGRTQFPADAFGPEISLGHSLATDFDVHSPDPKVVVIKYAKGGTSLYADWRAGGASAEQDGLHYRVFKQVVRDGLATLRVRYPETRLRLRALVWVQGESDAAAGIEPAAAYGRNLHTWIEDFRATVQAPELPILITRLSANQLKLASPGSPEYPAFLLVRAGQDNLSAHSPNVTTLDTDAPAFSFLPDQLHFDAVGQLALGALVAKSILEAGRSASKPSNNSNDQMP